MKIKIFQKGSIRLLLMLLFMMASSKNANAQLTTVTTQMVVTQDGAVIENMHFSNITNKQALVISANNVTVRNCLFTGCNWSIRISNYKHHITITGNRFENVGTAISNMGVTSYVTVSYNEGVGIGMRNCLLAENYGAPPLASNDQYIPFGATNHTRWASNFCLLENAKNCNIIYNIMDNKDTETKYLEDFINLYNLSSTGPDNNLIQGNKMRGTDFTCNISASGGGIVVDGVGRDISILDNIMIRASGYGLVVASGSYVTVENNVAYYPYSHVDNYNAHPNSPINKRHDAGSYAYGISDYHNVGSANVVGNELKNNLGFCIDAGSDIDGSGNPYNCVSWFPSGPNAIINLYEGRDGSGVKCHYAVMTGNTFPTTDPHWDNLLPNDMFANLGPEYFSYQGGGGSTPPVAPINLSATAQTSTSISLNWDDNTETNLAGYTVKRSTSSGTGYSVIATGVSASQYQDAGLLPQTTYYYVVTASNVSNDQSPNSSEASATTTAGTSTLPQPKSFYDFEEGSGTVVTDLASAGNNGTLQGTNITWATGGVGSASGGQGCVEITGSPYSGKSYVKIPFKTFHNSDNYTYSAWVKYTNPTPQWGYVFWQNGYDTTPTRHADLWWHPINSAVASVLHDTSGGEVRIDSPAPAGINVFDGAWHQVAITLENNHIVKIWEDGQLVTNHNSANPIAYTTNNDLWIGCKPSSPSNNSVVKMIGLIDRVRIYDVALTSSQIAEVYANEGTVGTTPPTPPTAPAGVGATGLEGKIDLNWSDNSEANISYNVKRAATASGSYQTIATVTTSAYSNTGLGTSATYYYVITAVDQNGLESANSTEVFATTLTPPPSAPTGVGATGLDGKIDLDWSDNSEANISYSVKRSTTSSGPYQTIATVTTSVYSNTGLAANATYYYVITAVDQNGLESGNSAEVSATTLTPSAPQPKSYYDFEAGSGTVVSDLGSANNDGTLEGNSIAWATGGVDGQGCVEITGSPYSGKSYVKVPFRTFHNSDNYTYSAWVKYTNPTPQWGYVFWQNGYDTTPTRHADLWWHPINSAVASVLHDTSGAEVRVDPPAPAGINVFDGNWHLVTISLENNNVIKIWEDGQRIVTTTSLNPIAYTTNNDLWVGCKPSSPSNNNVVKMVGFIDKVRIYDVALTDADVLDLYNGDVAGTQATQAAKIAAPQSSSFTLKQNWPNPFESETTISYELKEAGTVTLQVIDMFDNVVSVVEKGSRKPGKYNVKWTPPAGKKGIYFYRVTIVTPKGTFRDVKRMVIQNR